MDKNKCERCKTKKATYRCDECLTKLCGICARKTDFECYRCPPPELTKIRNKYD